MTPLYKYLKENGTTFYAFPGASEDISAAYQNDNITMNFDKFILLNIPKQNLTSGTANSSVVMDFENTFYKSSLIIPPNFKDQLVESLRNYVANHEITIKETRTGDNEYFYNNNAKKTPTERIFWKWCRKLNLIDFELATPSDEYFSDLNEFLSNDANQDDYFQEYLWKEREVIDYSSINFYQTGTTFSNNLEVEFSGTTNFKKGDKVKFKNISNVNISTLNGLQLDILSEIPAGLTQGQRLVFDYIYTSTFETETTGTGNLVYDRLVQYIGEITAVNNVQESNRSYTEVYAHIGDHQGKTPDVLFRTFSDDNYKPNLEYPILPSQYQPEIWGAENFSSPIVQNPENYPGDHFGQFDNNNYLYKTSSGDSIRRSGNYYGISGDVNNITNNSDNIDGVQLDFDTTHYAKMNIINQELDNFDEFNGFAVNNQPPVDFEFNAILWYYTIHDNVSGEESTNLYGITFLDNPNNNPNPSLNGLQIPTYKKFVNNGNQDGTSYAFSLNLNFNIINDNIQPAFNSNNINSLFSFELFNEAMKRLSSTNDSYNTSLAEHDIIKSEISNIKQLLYTQNDLTTINNKIKNLEELLLLYQSLQLVSTDSIEVIQNQSQSPPAIELHSKDSTYFSINNIKTTDLYTTNGIVPYNVSVPDGKDFLIRIYNNDETEFNIPNDDKLSVILDRDLDFKQSVDIIIDGSDYSTQNKKLDIYTTFKVNNEELPTQTLIISDIELPIFFNDTIQSINSSKNWEQIKLDVDLNSPIKILPGDLMEISLNATNGILEGDTFLLNNFVVGSTVSVDYASQYKVSFLGTASPTIQLDISNNSDLVSFASTQILPFEIHGATQSILQSLPNLSLNKGYKFTITRINSSDNSTISERYLISGGILDYNISGGNI